jgi:5-methylcytosine-specific restriction endonuclease McrA
MDSIPLKRCSECCQYFSEIIGVFCKDCKEKDNQRRLEAQKVYGEQWFDEYLRQRAVVWQHNRYEDLKRRARERIARINSLPKTFSSQHWNRALMYFNNGCAVCGQSFESIKSNKDHWIPISHPDCPGTIPLNMICLCGSCNSSKSDLHPQEWLERKFGCEKSQEITQRIETYFNWIKEQEST